MDSTEQAIEEAVALSPLDVPNLRREMPVWDTPGLEWQWQEVLKQIVVAGEFSVPCAMGIDTRAMLFKIVRAMEARSVLDIGTYVGTSAFAYALACGTYGNVTTVDLHDANAPDGHWARAGRACPPRRMLTDAGVAERVDFVTMDSRDFLRHTTRKYDFISIDGWHEDFCVYEEIKLALQVLSPRGLIFLDDVHPVGFVPPEGRDYIDGPRAALDQHLAEKAPFDAWYPADQLVAFLLQKET